MMFKDEADKFSGTQQSKTPLHEVREAFITATIDHEIPRDKSVDLMHVCLTGMAKKFYYRSIR